MNLAIAQSLVRISAWALAVVFGSAGVFMIWASIYVPEASGDALKYLAVACALEWARPKR